MFWRLILTFAEVTGEKLVGGLFVTHLIRVKEKEICPAYMSKIHSNFEKQIVLLRIPNEKKGW